MRTMQTSPNSPSSVVQFQYSQAMKASRQVITNSFSPSCFCHDCSLQCHHVPPPFSASLAFFSFSALSLSRCFFPWIFFSLHRKTHIHRCYFPRYAQSSLLICLLAYPPPAKHGKRLGVQWVSYQFNLPEEFFSLPLIQFSGDVAHSPLDSWDNHCVYTICVCGCASCQSD